MENKVAAVIVGYNPDDDILLQLIESLSKQVFITILVDNGNSKKVYLEALKKGMYLKYIDLGTNKGLGYALNIGFEIASSMSLKYVTTFDQDSLPDENMIAALVQAFEELSLTDKSIAAVGPRFFDRREKEKVYAPFCREENGRILYIDNKSVSHKYVNVDTLITSGMLISTKVWISGVKYNESFFIDYTDPEWCFHARSFNYKIYGCLNVEMAHAASNSPPLRIFGYTFFRYSPLRRYYTVRNILYFCSLPYVSFAWKRKLLIGVIPRIIINVLIDEEKLKSIKMMLLGLSHAFQKKYGKLSL
jgi:rhamnosyltransferase